VAASRQLDVRLHGHHAARRRHFLHSTGLACTPFKATVDLTAPTVTISVPPVVNVTATDANGLPNGTTVTIDVDTNNDGNFTDPGETGYARDGIYVIRTNEPKRRLSATNSVRSSKRLAQVKQAFRSLKGLDLLVRPFFHRVDPRVHAHILLCRLAYKVEWPMRRALAPVVICG
jgi:hypothetical protein